LRRRTRLAKVISAQAEIRAGTPANAGIDEREQAGIAGPFAAARGG
jgi:hypothetical protein